jgi:hypothetical protein
MSDESKLIRGHCIHCGLPVKKVRDPIGYYGRGTPQDQWIHTADSVDGVPKCDKHFLTIEEVVPGGAEVPVQD